ncbi:MAG: SgcJ/EcaC family oxidoreductase [Acidimicrobiales bacterium]|jgi:uncharacterized protein (TIGR02246 family)
MEPTAVAEEIAAAFARAWNRHDMPEFGALFDEGATFVNIVGVLMTGRGEIEEQHGRVHAGPYRNSVLAVSVHDAVALAPGIVLCHVRAELSGDERRPGETRSTILTFVITGEGDRWKVSAAHNTVVAPPPDAVTPA